MYGHPPNNPPMFTEACDPLPYHHHRNNVVGTLQVNDDNLIHNKQHQQPQQQQQQQYYGGRYRSMSSNNFDHLTASAAVADKMLHRISPLLIDCNQNIDTRRNDPPLPTPSSSHSLHHQHQRNFAVDHSSTGHSKLHGKRGTPVGISSSSNEHHQQQQRCSTSNNIVVVDEKYATGVCRVAGNSRNEYFITHATNASSQQPHNAVQGRPPAAATVACRNPPRWAPRESDQYNNYQYHYYQQQQQQANRFMLMNEQARRLSPLSSSTFGPGQSCFNERPSSRWMLSQENDVQQPSAPQQQQTAVATSYHSVAGNESTRCSSRQDETTTTKRKKLAMYKVTTQLRQLRMDLNQIRSSTMDFKREIEADFARLNSIIANNKVTRKTTTGSDSATDEALIPRQQTPLTDQVGNQMQQRYEQKSDLLQLPNKCNRVDDITSRLSSLSGGGGSPPSRCSTSSLPMTVNCANLLETPEHDHVSMIGRQCIQPHQESECSVDSGYQDQFGSILMSRASGVPLHSPIVETPPVKSVDNSATSKREAEASMKEEGHHQRCHLTAPPSGSCYRNEAWLEAAMTSPHASSEWLDISQVISPEVETAAAAHRRDSASQVRPIPKERKTLKKSKSDIAAMRSNDEMIDCDMKSVRTSTSSTDNTGGSSSKKENGNHRIISPTAQQQRKIKLGVSAISVANKNQKEGSVKNQQIKKQVDNYSGHDDDEKEAREQHGETKTEEKEETHQQQEVIRRRSMRMMTELQIYELDELGFTRPVVENVTTSGNPGKKTKAGDSSKKDGTEGHKKRKNQSKKRDEYPCSTSPPTIVDNPQSMVISQSWDIYRVGSPEDVRRPRPRLPHAFSLSPNQQYTNVESPQPLPRKSNQPIGSSACTTPSRIISNGGAGAKAVKEVVAAGSSGATNAFVGASVMSAFSPVLSTSLFSLNSLGENESGGNFKRRTSLPLSSRKSQFYDQHVRPLVAETTAASVAVKEAPMLRANRRTDGGKGNNDSRKSRRSHPSRQRHQSAEEDLRSEASLYQHQQQQQRYGDYCDNRAGYNDGGFPHHARTLSAFVTPTNTNEFVQRKLPKYHELPVKRSNHENGMSEHNSRVGNSSTEAVSDRKQQNRSALTASIAKHNYQRENTNGQAGSYENKGVTKSSANKSKTTSAVSSMFKANFISRKMKGSGDQSLRKSYNPRDRSSTTSASSTEAPSSVSSKLKSKVTAPSTKLKKSFYNGGGGGKKVSSSSYADVDSSFEEPLTATKAQSTKSRGAMQRIRNSFRNPRQKTKMFGGAVPPQQPHSISEHQNNSSISSSSRRRDEHEATSRTNLGIQLFLDPHKSSTQQQQQQQQQSSAHPSGNISYV